MCLSCLKTKHPWAIYGSKFIQDPTPTTANFDKIFNTSTALVADSKNMNYISIDQGVQMLYALQYLPN